MVSSNKKKTKLPLPPQQENIKKKENLKNSYISSPKKLGLDYNAERALEQLGADKAEITPLTPQAKDAYLLGASREHQEQLAKSNIDGIDNVDELASVKEASISRNERLNLKGIPQKLGSYIRAWLNLDTEQAFNYHPQQEEEITPINTPINAPLMKAPINTLENRALLSAKEMQALKNINSESLDFEASLQKEIASKKETPPLLKEEEKFDYNADKAALYTNSQSKRPLQAEPQFSASPLATAPLAASRLSAAPLKKAELKLPLDFTKRAERIHKLLEQGYTKQEISFAAGLSLAQVNLIAALPQAPQSSQAPRRKRLAVE